MAPPAPQQLEEQQLLLQQCPGAAQVLPTLWGLVQVPEQPDLRRAHAHGAPRERTSSRAASALRVFAAGRRDRDDSSSDNTGLCPGL